MSPGITVPSYIAEIANCCDAKRRLWPVATARQVAIAVANEGRTDMGQSGQNDAVDPQRHFATVNCRIAKGSFDHLVGARARPGRIRRIPKDGQPTWYRKK